MSQTVPPENAAPTSSDSAPSTPPLPSTPTPPESTPNPAPWVTADTIKNAAESNIEPAELAAPWRRLKFEERAFWATATSELSLVALGAKRNIWQFSAHSSVPGNSEELTLIFFGQNGQMIGGERLALGQSDKRYKSFIFKPSHILRKRHSPNERSGDVPEKWPVTSRKFLTYPATQNDLVLTNPYLLLIIAGALQTKEKGATAEALVLTDLNFYRVKLEHIGTTTIEAEVKVEAGPPIAGKREVNVIKVLAQAEGELEEKDDFSVLGLEGEVTILFDKVTGLPLQVRGDAPRLGSSKFSLKNATLRAPSP